MYICYIDESGDAGTFQLTDINSNPFFVIVGLIIKFQSLRNLTHEFISLKNKFFPDHFKNTSKYLDGILVEIKGSDLRKELRGKNRRRLQNTIGFLNACIRLLNKYGVRLIAKATVKDPGRQNSDAGLYGSGMMYIYTHFNDFLYQNGEKGFVIADSRKVPQNKTTCHTIFTQINQATGNSYPHILEMPAYGHSNNFAMLQLADIVCSGIIFPMLCDAFSAHLHGVANVHISQKYASVRKRYKDEIKNMQFRYQDANGYWQGGLLISDSTSFKRRTRLIFQ